MKKAGLTGCPARQISGMGDGMKWPTESKYHNRRVVVDGIMFDSRRKYVFQNM